MNAKTIYNDMKQDREKRLRDLADRQGFRAINVYDDVLDALIENKEDDKEVLEKLSN
jgi:hypothetical protein